MIVNEMYSKNEEVTLKDYLSKCGVTDYEEFLNPMGKYLDNCFMYNNMLDAIQMFKYHYLQNDGVYILCDSGDTDGITSAFIMYKYMTMLNSEWDIEILLHEGKQRGLQDIELFNKVLSNPKGLLIIPDSGTNDREQVDIIYEKTNMDVLVLDHHSCSQDKCNTKGVLVNNQLENDKISKYGSGCLVTHKFLEALDIEFHKNWANYFIDVVALSLISDSMEMFDEQNRTYYHYGLETIDCVNNDFLRELIIKFIGDRPYTQKDIAFNVVPKINSICRSTKQDLKQKILLSFLGQEDISQMLKVCESYHKEQKKLVDKIIEKHEEEINSKKNDNLIILACEDMPKSYSGLVAGKIKEMCGNKPIIIGKIKDGEFLGSLRSPIPLRTELDNNELVNWAQGHEDSCGVSILEKNIEPLISYYNTLSLTFEPYIDVVKSYPTNCIPKTLGHEFSQNLAVFGKGIDPKFHFTFEYIPNKMNILGTYGTTLTYTSNGYKFVWQYMNRYKKVDLHLGYLDETCIHSSGLPKFIVNPTNIKYTINIIGSFVSDNEISVDKYWLEEVKKKTVNDLF